LNNITVPRLYMPNWNPRFWNPVLTALTVRPGLCHLSALQHVRQLTSCETRKKSVTKGGKTSLMDKKGGTRKTTVEELLE